jgi:hypothetical protein
MLVGELGSNSTSLPSLKRPILGPRMIAPISAAQQPGGGRGNSVNHSCVRGMKATHRGSGNAAVGIRGPAPRSDRPPLLSSGHPAAPPNVSPAPPPTMCTTPLPAKSISPFVLVK